MRNTHVRSNSETTVGYRRLGLFVVCITIYLLCACGVASAQVVHPATDYPRTVDPWEVILFEHTDFTGSWVSYKIETGMRHRLVRQSAQEDHVSSIQVGSNVCVQIFEHRFFAAGSPSHAPEICASRRELGSLDLNDKLSSLIVYPKEGQHSSPAGITLRHGDHTAFFPLPEVEQQRTAAYAELGNVDSDKNADTLTIHNRNVEVTLYAERNFKGEIRTLPGGGESVESAFWHLANFGWADKPASLIVRWIGPIAQGPPPPSGNFTTKPGMDLPGSDYKSFFIDGGPEECQAACTSDPNCKAFTWVKPGVQGAKAACWLKSKVPAAVDNPNCVSGYTGGGRPTLQVPPLPPGGGKVVFIPDISGKWQSSIGVVYKITQTGDQFTWQVKNGTEQGSGKIAFPQITASWYSNNVATSATGKVIVDAAGKAIRIEWDNGIIFFKQ